MLTAILDSESLLPANSFEPITQTVPEIDVCFGVVRFHFLRRYVSPSRFLSSFYFPPSSRQRYIFNFFHNEGINMQD